MLGFQKSHVLMVTAESSLGGTHPVFFPQSLFVALSFPGTLCNKCSQSFDLSHGSDRYLQTYSVALHAGFTKLHQLEGVRGGLPHPLGLINIH